MIAPWNLMQLVPLVLLLLGAALAQYDDDSPTGQPSLQPTTYLQTQLSIFGSNYIDGSSLPSLEDFKTRYRFSFECSVADSVSLPNDRPLHCHSVSVQDVSRASVASLLVRYRVQLMMEDAGFLSQIGAFNSVHADLQNATKTGLLSDSFNISLSEVSGITARGLHVTNFSALLADMEVAFLRSYSPTASPTAAPTSAPLKNWTIAFTLAAIIAIGILFTVLSSVLDYVNRRVSPGGHEGHSSSIKSAKSIVAGAIPCVSVDTDEANKSRCALILRNISSREIWLHHRWIGTLIPARYRPRPLRVGVICSYCLCVLLFVVLYVRSWTSRDSLPPINNFSHIFVDIIFHCVCFTSIVSSFFHGVIESWYFVVLGSYSKQNKLDLKVNQRDRNGYPSAPIDRAVSTTTNNDKNNEKDESVRDAQFSPQQHSTIQSPTKSNRSRRISVRAATSDFSLPKHQNSDALSLFHSQDNLDPRKKNNFEISSANMSRVVASGPVIGAYNVTRLQNELLYCRAAIMSPVAESSRELNSPGSENKKKVQTLSYKRLLEFDRVWGLDGMGRLREDIPRSSINSAYQTVVNELFAVQRATGIELKKMRQPAFLADPLSVSEDLVGRNRRRLVQLFHLDTLPFLEKSVVHNQISREERILEPVILDKRLKVFGCVCTLAVAASFIFLIFWFSQTLRNETQTAILIIFVSWLIADFFLVSSVSLAIKHVFIPSLSREEVSRVVFWFNRKLDKLYDDPTTTGNETDSPFMITHGRNISLDKSTITGDIASSDVPSWISLNAAQHFFLSCRVAGVYPISFPEISVISSFHTIWPKKHLGSIYGSQILTSQNSDPLTMVSIDPTSRNNDISLPAQWMIFPTYHWHFFLHIFLSLPLRFQDLLVDVLSWAFVIGSIYLHFYLYFINPWLPIVPVPFIIVLAILLFKILSYFTPHADQRADDSSLWRPISTAAVDSFYVSLALKGQKGENAVDSSFNRVRDIENGYNSENKAKSVDQSLFSEKEAVKIRIEREISEKLRQKQESM